MTDEANAAYGEADKPLAPPFPRGAVFISEETADVQAPEVAPLEFTWGMTQALFVGDCRLAAATLSIFPDGHCEWRANEVSSRDPGDDSWCSTFSFYTHHGIHLWTFGRICSPTLWTASIVWVDNNRLFYPSYQFSSIGRVNMLSHC